MNNTECAFDFRFLHSQHSAFSGIARSPFSVAMRPGLIVVQLAIYKMLALHAALHFVETKVASHAQSRSSSRLRGRARPRRRVA